MVDRLVKGVNRAAVAPEHVDQHVLITWESTAGDTALPRTSICASCVIVDGLHLCSMAVDYETILCMEGDEENSGRGIYRNSGYR